MRIGAVGVGSYQPYIYNTNTVSRASLNKVGKIGDDLLDKKTDFSELTQENVNPLKKGETRNYEDIYNMQMQMGQMNATRLFREAPEQVASDTESITPITQAADTLISRDMNQLMQAANIGATLDFAV